MGESVVDPALLESVSRKAMETLSPDELPLLPMTVESFDARGGRLPRVRTVEESLGFGVAEAVMVVGPTVVMIASECLKTLVSEATKGATGAARRRLAAAVQRRHLQEPDETTPQLTDEERERLRAVARSAARRGGLPDEKADAVVEAVLDALPGGQRR